MAYGHKSVIGHRSEQEIVHFTKQAEKIQLCETPRKQNGLISEYVYGQYLGNCGGGEADIHKGQIAEQEVHGGMQVRVCADSQDDEQVSKDSGKVSDEEKQKEELLLLLGLRGESQEKELGNPRLVDAAHESEPSYRREKKRLEGHLQVWMLQPGSD